MLIDSKIICQVWPVCKVVSLPGKTFAKTKENGVKSVDNRLRLFLAAVTKNPIPILCGRSA